MVSLLTIVLALLDILFWIIIIQAILSWLVAFNVLNIHQPFVNQIWRGLTGLTEPLYRPIRNLLPDMGGIDLTPMVVLFCIFALQTVIVNNLGPYAFG
ncbi:MAG: YggT family protein [Pseudomonadota bacterium]